MSLPQAEAALKNHFGNRYVDKKWRPALDVVMVAEQDTITALEGINKLRHSLDPTASTTPLPLHVPTMQCADLEEDLMLSVKELKSRNRIFGPLPMIKELINPSEERENEDNSQILDDDAIVAQVHYEKALEQGEIIEIESEEEKEENEDTLPQVTITKALEMCRVLDSFCLDNGTGIAMELSRVLHHLWAEVSWDYMQNMKQSTLVDLWGCT